MLRKVLLFTLLFISFLGYTQDNINQLKKQLNSASNDKQKSELLLKICNQYFKNKKSIDSVFRYAKQLENIAIKTDDNNLLAIAYDKTNRAHYLAGHHDLAIKFGGKAIKLYEEERLLIASAIVKRTMGFTYQAIYNNKEAIRYFLEAEKLLPEDQKVTTYIGLGAANAETNNLEKAIGYYNQAFEIATRLKLTQHYYNVYNGLAVVYLKDKEQTKSLEYFQKALEYTIKEKDFLGQTVCYNNIGDVYKILKNYPSAKESYETGITLFDRMSHKFLKANIYASYAETLLHLDSLELAETNLNKAEDIMSQINNTFLSPSIANTKASIKRKKGNLQQAALILENAVNQSKKNKNQFSDFEKQNHLSLSEIYQELNMPQKALISYKRYSAIQDSITARIKAEEIESLKIKFDISSYEQDLKVKNQELITAEAKKEKSNYRNILLGFLSLWLIFFLYRQRKLNNIHRKTMLAENQVAKLKEEQLHTEMKYKNSQITEYAIHINERNRFQDTCIDKIKYIKKEAEQKEVRDSLSTLQFYITENINVNNEKIALNKGAKITEESFIFTLKNQFPTLTAKEIKVATFLVLELPSKSIANQMGINQQSVNNYRFSIRKKLGVSKSDDLIAFLKAI
ncbi:MAG: hypothetical protein COA88_11690 [Kordia sp.]|nr:MAG: hypothetical protein COA88_11690 [Kordia sp.]